MSKILTVSAYCRVSTEKDDQINSFDSQMKYFRQYIKNNENWRLGEIYFDEGISGTSVKKREGFNRMIADALSGKFNLIITKEVSRFARNTVDTLTFTRKLKECGVGVYFVSDNINTLDKDGEFRLTVMASLAQEESRKTSERVKWGQTRKMEQGVVFGRDLLGYSVENGSLIVDEGEAEIVKLIFHKFVNEGKGTWTISRELFDSGIRAKRGFRWSNSTILKILRNEKYVGDLCQKKTYTPDFLTHLKKRNCKEESKIYLINHHKPIIDRNTFERTQAELSRRSPSNEQKIKYSNRYWCSGKIFCECGARFVSTTKTLKNGSKYKAWRCCESAIYGKKKVDNCGNIIGCNNSSINDSFLLTFMGYLMRKFQIKNRDIIVREIVDEISQIRSLIKPIDSFAIKTKLEKMYEKKKRAIDVYVEGLIPKEDLKRQIKEYDRQISLLLEQLNQAQNMNNIQNNQFDKIQDIISEIEKIMNFGKENELLYQEHLEKIVVHNNKSITIYLKHLFCGINIVYKRKRLNEGFDAVIINTQFR